MAEISLPNGFTPRPYQAKAMSYYDKGGKRGVFCWPRRCIGVGTMVTMADGSWKRIEELQKGDEILSWVDGAYCADQVSDVWNAGVKPVVRVSCAGFPDVVSTGDHQFYVRHDGKKGAWRAIGDIKAKSNTGSRHHVTICALANPGTANVAHAELFGHLVTDGSVNQDQSPKYTNVQPELIERVCELALAAGAVPRVRPKGNGWDVGLSNGTRGGGTFQNPIKELFRDEEALFKRSLRRVPKSMWQADRASLAAFFGAVIDGDGSLWRHAARTAFGGKHITSKAEVKIHAGESEALAWDYYWLLRKLGVVANRVVFEKESCWTVRLWTVEATRRLLSAIKCRHPSKEAKRVEILADVEAVKERLTWNGLYSGSVATTPDGMSETWDIETAKNGCFFANGYLVHNSGKDLTFLHQTIKEAHARPGTYYHLLPSHTQARKVMWDGILNSGKRVLDVAIPKELRASENATEMKIVLKCGAVWQLVGADYFDTIMGTNPFGLVFSEAALTDPRSWSYFRPILAANGGWAAFISTPRGYNWFYDLLEHAKEAKEWAWSHLNARQTGHISEEVLAQEKAEMPDELFRQEYECSFSASNLGSILGRYVEAAENEGRINDSIEYDPEGAGIEISSDIGRRHISAWWFWQPRADGFGLVDYDEDAGLDASDWIDRLKLKIGDRKIKHIWLPHDAKAKTFVARHSAIEQFAKAFGADIVKLSPQTKKEHSINAGQVVMRSCRFHRTRCAAGLKALRAWSRQYDPERRSYSADPLDDWSCDAADAYCEGAKIMRKRVLTVEKKTAPPRSALTMTLDDWWAAKEEMMNMERAI